MRPSRTFDDKLAAYKELGFDAVQFHDDDAVPNVDDLSSAQIRKAARAMRQKLADHGLLAEFVAPRLWEHPITILESGVFIRSDDFSRLVRGKSD